MFWGNTRRPPHPLCDGGPPPLRRRWPQSSSRFVIRVYTARCSSRQICRCCLVVPDSGVREPFFNRGGSRSKIKFYHVTYVDFHQPLESWCLLMLYKGEGNTPRSKSLWLELWGVPMSLGVNTHGRKSQQRQEGHVPQNVGWAANTIASYAITRRLILFQIRLE